VTLAAAGRQSAGTPVERLPDGSAAKDMITPAAQQAIDGGLAYLAQGQHPDGSFGTGQFQGNVAITSLAALALMAGGNQPGRGTYGRAVRNALDFVLNQEQGRRGYLLNQAAPASPNGPMYGHGFGTLFLGEVYGMVHHKDLRTRLRGTLKRAVDLIIYSQNAKGGWRYTPEAQQADISVTICQIMALRSARNAGLSVPKTTVDRCIEYVKRCQNPETGGFRYMDYGGEDHTSFARTAAGVSALYSAGIYKDPAVDKGLAYLMRWLRDGQQMRRDLHRRDMYYFYGHYYAVQVMWTAGGSYWSEWFPFIRDELSDQRRPNGSWNDHHFCAHYNTAMACIILQVPNNYLPILQK
jgi:hypothetical protein